MRRMSTRVLPAPAEASTQTVGEGAVTAWCWEGVRSATSPSREAGPRCSRLSRYKLGWSGSARPGFAGRDRARQDGLGQEEAGQEGAGQEGAGRRRPGANSQACSSPYKPAMTGTEDAGTEDAGTADLGTSDLGTADLGTADLGIIGAEGHGMPGPAGVGE